MSIARAVLTDADSKWSKLINCVLDQTAPNVARTTALNLGYEAFFRGQRPSARTAQSTTATFRG